LSDETRCPDGCLAWSATQKYMDCDSPHGWHEPPTRQNTVLAHLPVMASNTLGRLRFVMTEPNQTDEPRSRRGPEGRHADNARRVREKALDKTLADTFPASDPLSTLPDPSSDQVNLSRSDEEAA
jgi:hypothetical protein